MGRYGLVFHIGQRVKTIGDDNVISNGDIAFPDSVYSGSLPHTKNPKKSRRGLETPTLFFEKPYVRALWPEGGGGPQAPAR